MKQLNPPDELNWLIQSLDDVGRLLSGYGCHVAKDKQIAGSGMLITLLSQRLREVSEELFELK